jgi:hypothetical protein
MWQPMTGPHGTSTTNHNTPRVKHRLVHVLEPYCHINLSCQLLYCPITLPRHSPYCPVILPCQPADVTHATCHPFSGDTCHLGIGPTVHPKVKIYLPHVTTQGYHMSPVRTCHMSSVQTCHVSVRMDYTVNNLFACLTFRTECDIFSIWTPFDKVNIPPESRRQDGRNGTGFVAFRALLFLSIFQALSGFWIRFWITPPHNKTFWSPKGY